MADEMTEEVFSEDEMKQVGDSSAQVTKVTRWFEEAKKYRAKREKQWRINEDLLRNRIDMSGARTQTDLRFNLPLAVVESIKPPLNDFLPTFQIIPEGRNDVLWAELVQKRKKQIEQIGKFKTNVMYSVSDSLEYSDGLIEVRPLLEPIAGEDEPQTEEEDADVQYTLKGIEFIPTDPFTWYPAPHSVGMELGENARYHIFAVPMHKDEVKRIYGVTVSGEGQLDDQRAWVANNDDDESGGDYSLVLTCYCVDEDEDKYPYGRVTVVIENRLVSDEPLELYRIPFFQFSNYKSAHDTFGYSEPELVATQTKAINEGMSSMFDGLREAGNPKVKIVKSLFNRLTKNFFGMKKIEVNRPDDVTYLQPSAPSATMMSAINLTLELIDVITRTNDVSAGRNQQSQATSGRAIMALQEASNARVRYKIDKEVAPVIEEIGEMVAWLIKNFDREMISLREEMRDGGQKFIDFDPNMSKEQALALADQEGIDFTPDEFRPLADTQFNVMVKTGYDAPEGLLSRKEEADINFDAGRIGIEQWVQDTGHPDGKTVIDEYYERQGDAQRKELQEEIAKELPDLIELARENPEEFQGSPEEDQLFQMAMQLPEIMGGEDFKSLPQEIKMRIAQAVVSQESESA